MPIGERSIVGRVMYQAIRSASWFKDDADVSVAMLVPYEDPLKDQFKHHYDIFEGPEEDVLTRYKMAVESYESDYVVRLTGDCAWIQSKIITKMLRDCLKYEADYCSNVLVRTFMEGLDVEVLSRRLVDYLDETVEQTDKFDREHVTTRVLDEIAMGHFKRNFVTHTVLSEYDMSHLKTSIDTAEEYREGVLMFNQYRDKKNEAESYGSISN